MGSCMGKQRRQIIKDVEQKPIRSEDLLKQQPKSASVQQLQSKQVPNKPSDISKRYPSLASYAPVFYKRSQKMTLIQKLDCPICLIDFNLQKNIPMMICLRQHNVCRQCLETLPLFKKEFKCPLCNQDCINQNILVNRLLQLLLEQEQLDQKFKAPEIQHFSQLKRIQKNLNSTQKKTSKKSLIQKNKQSNQIDAAAARSNIVSKSQYNFVEGRIIPKSEFQQSELAQRSNILFAVQQYKKDYIINKNEKLSHVQLQKSHRDVRSYQRLVVQNEIELLVSSSIQRQQIAFQKEHANYQVIPSNEFHQSLLVIILDHNFIKNIVGISHLKSLTLLSLNYNLIQKIENLEGLQRLKILSLMCNKIHLIQNLENLEYLLQVDLRKNNIDKKSKQNRKAVFQLKDRQVLIDL